MITLGLELVLLVLVLAVVFVCDRERRRLDRMADEVRSRTAHPSRRRGDVPLVRMVPTKRGDRKGLDS